MIPIQNIVDTHVHFWNTQQFNYDWLTNKPQLQKPFLPTDYALATEPNPVNQVIFVEANCNAPTQVEAEWVLELSRQYPFIVGIVAHAPLEEGERVHPILQQLVANPLVKSVRRNIQNMPSGFTKQSTFITGTQILANYGLPSEICIRAHQLPEIIELVEQCSDVRFVLNHIGKPNIAIGEFQPWAEHLGELAHFENVHCKVSGLVTEADHQNWNQTELVPYIDHVIKIFGIERVMFGSDYPVCNLAASFEAWLSALNNATQHLTVVERDLLFSSNAQRFYKLS